MTTEVAPPIPWLPYARLTTLERDRSFLAIAYRMAEKYSTDPSTQNGSVLVRPNLANSEYEIIAQGANYFPAGVQETPERWDRSVKLFYVEHAERKSLYQAAREGKKTEGTILYCPWYACSDCARAIIETGVFKVVGHKQVFDKTPERWHKTIAEAFVMFQEAGVECQVYDGEIGGVKVRFDGQVWEP